jgi:hypothetical protein
LSLSRSLINIFSRGRLTGIIIAEPGADVYMPKLLKQQATYWAQSTPDGFGGKSFASPMLIRCRWEDKSELFVDSQGNEVKSTSIVMVDRDLAIGGYLALGESENAIPTGSHEIRGFDKIPDVGGKKFVRKAYL